jgi:hypothetical protein
MKMKIWKSIIGGAIGSAAAMAAPFTGGLSVLVLAKYLEKDTVKEAKASGFEDGFHDAKAEAAKEIKRFADYDLALTALVYYFARCDGSISKEEEQEIDYALNAIQNHKNIPDSLRAELNRISQDEDLRFEEVVQYLDRLPLNELCSFTEYVNNIVEASDGITPAEATAKQKFEEYLQTKKCAC